MQASKRQQNAQALTEFVVVWPVLLWAICLVLQLLLLTWAHSTLAIGTQYAVRAGAINHGSQTRMETTLVTVMAGIKPQLDIDEPLLAVQKAIVEQRIHLLLYGQLNRVSPTAKQFQQYAHYRYDPESERRVKEIAVDHYQARRRQHPSDDWAAARQLKITTEWCYNLVIPLAAEFLGWLAEQQGNCLAGNRVGGLPQWPLSSHAEHPLLSGFRVN